MTEKTRQLAETRASQVRRDWLERQPVIGKIGKKYSNCNSQLFLVLSIIGSCLCVRLSESSKTVEKAARLRMVARPERK